MRSSLKSRRARLSGLGANASGGCTSPSAPGSNAMWGSIIGPIRSQARSTRARSGTASRNASIARISYGDVSESASIWSQQNWVAVSIQG
jgi:hypothetical protein